MAVSDSARALATGVDTVERSGDRARDHRAISELAGEYGVVAVVVGVPYSLSGQAGPAASAVLEEVAQLRSVLSVDIETVDERLTTVQAAGALRASGRKGRRTREVIDRTAAAVILQSWMDRAAAIRPGAAQTGAAQ